MYQLGREIDINFSYVKPKVNMLFKLFSVGHESCSDLHLTTNSHGFGFRNNLRWVEINKFGTKEV